MTTTTLDGGGAPYVIAAGTVVQANDGDALVVLGSIDNAGTISLNGTGIASPTPTTGEIAFMLLASPTVTLGGGGTLLLAGGYASYVFGSGAATQTLVNADTITGAGVIGVLGTGSLTPSLTPEPVLLVNAAGGVIDASGTVAATGGNQQYDGLVVVAGGLGMVNDGLLEASGVGGLAIEGNRVDQTGGGTLLASGAGVAIQFFGTIAGGTVQTQAGGQIVLDGLDGSAGAVTVAAGTTLVPVTLLGDIINRGTLLSSNQATNAQTDIVLASPTVTLSGGGTVLLTAINALNRAGAIHGADAATHTLVNVDNTISGFGAIGLAADNGGTATPVALVNGSAGVIDATGQNGTAEQLTLFAGGAVLRNGGLLEASAGGSLLITDASLDNTGGLILATGSGAVVSLATVTLSGGQIASAAGGGVAFIGGGNTLIGAGGLVTLAVGAALTLSVGASVNLQAATLDNAGTLFDAGELTLTQPVVTLDGGGAISLAGSIDTGATATLVNVDNTITGGGHIVGPVLSLTNDAAGVLIATTLDLPQTVRNLGVLENVTAGLGNVTTTIDNSGGTLLANAGTVALFDADILGGTLAARNGGLFTDGSEFLGSGGNLTLDGSASAVTIAAGTTLQAWVTGVSLPFYFDVPQNLTFLGTVDLLGTVDALNTDPFGGGGTFTNQGVLVAGPAGNIAGNLTNAGTVVVSAGSFAIGGNVAGAGTIALAAGATFDLGGARSNTVDFGGHADASLVLGGPAASFTGTLANLAYGDTIDLVGAQLNSASIVGGATLALGLAGGGTLDYALASPEAGLTVALGSATPTPTEVIDFTYTTTVTTSLEPGSTTSGTGSFTVTTGTGSAGLASVTAFTLDIAVSTNGGGAGGLSGTDQITYDLANLTSFSATFNSTDTLTGLSLAASYGGGSTFYSARQDFAATGLGAGDASTVGQTAGQPLLSRGSLAITPAGPLLSDVVMACFAAGTRIRAARGMVAVEALRVGEMVLTAAGRRAPVRWLGHRRVDCPRHPRPRDVWPVRLRAGAFGPGLPSRDLFLSPDHALFLDGVLIPVRHLIDGAAIAREAWAEVTYWHVELDRHDVILAEGLACESFLDTGQRAAFANGAAAVQLHPDFAARAWDADACAPLVVAGPALERARARLRTGHAGASLVGRTARP